MMAAKLRFPLDLNVPEQAHSNDNYSEFYKDAKQAAQNIKLCLRSEWFKVAGVLIALMVVFAIYWFYAY